MPTGDASDPPKSIVKNATIEEAVDDIVGVRSGMGIYQAEVNKYLYQMVICLTMLLQRIAKSRAR